MWSIFGVCRVYWESDHLMFSGLLLFFICNFSSIHKLHVFWPGLYVCEVLKIFHLMFGFGPSFCSRCVVQGWYSFAYFVSKWLCVAIKSSFKCIACHSNTRLPKIVLTYFLFILYWISKCVNTIICNIFIFPPNPQFCHKSYGLSFTNVYSC